MIVNNIKRYELEITSRCNAECPACLRTKYPNNYELASITLNDIKRIFPTKDVVDGKEFLLCGALGDPVVNKECYDITKYLLDLGGWVMYNTNGSLETTNWWKKVAKLSAETKRLNVWFCVDGCEETNEIYRVNTNFDIIKRNMEAYTSVNGAIGSWVYIIFDHNEQEIEKARSLANKFGLEFALRKGAGNTIYNWKSNVKKRDKETKEIKIIQNVITSKKNAHSKVDVVKELLRFNKWKWFQSKEKRTKIVNSIKCKFYHEKELFIASNQTLWPCCFLWSATITHPNIAKEKFDNYDENWNSLLHHSIDEILQHPWFDVILKESWDPAHKMHISKCITNCAYNQAHQHEIVYDNK